MFLALGVGIVVGSTVIARGTLSIVEGRLNGVEKNARQVDATNRRLTNQFDTWNRFATFGVVSQRRLQHRDRFGMIAVVVIGETDLYAQVAGRLIVEFGARFGRLIHRNGRQRIAIVALLLECRGKSATCKPQHCGMINSVCNQ